MNVLKTASAVTSLRPHTCPSSSVRRLKPPPVILKLNVHVPSNHSSKDSDNDDSDDDEDDDDDDDDDSSDDEATRNRKRQQRKRMKPRVAWGKREEAPHARGGSAKQEVKRTTK